MDLRFWINILLCAVVLIQGAVMRDQNSTLKSAVHFIERIGVIETRISTVTLEKEEAVAAYKAMAAAFESMAAANHKNEENLKKVMKACP